MIQKLLIANRGEIAVRIIRAARELGIRTVAVYSEADESSIHTQLADEAYGIGAPEPAASYLNIEKIIEIAKQSGADAIHPGYGFLSERAEFVDACHAAGITFVGPSASAMRRLGGKIDAKTLAVSVNVPVTPGFFEVGASDQSLKEAAAKIGYPVLLKASAGGGGRGMRIVRDAADFDQELKLAREESIKAFGDGAMMVEKLVERPRHVEVQILADHHGNAVVLFERECSIQRRHQKLIEEAPSPLYSADIPTEPSTHTELWQKMREASLSLIKAAEYTNAGTVEFIVDEASHEFYFLEVNARLQVEHPVTEMITGIDLVQWQLKIASGEKLELPGELLSGSRSCLNGHAIEARIVAEDPAQNFMPSIGKILGWAEPSVPGLRIDTGFSMGSEVTRYYDSMIAKVIAFGATRSDAIRKLKQALLDFHVLGVRTNIAYTLEILEHPDFLEGKMDTGFLGREFPDWSPDFTVPEEIENILLQSDFDSRTDQKSNFSVPAKGAWALNDGFRISSPR